LPVDTGRQPFDTLLDATKCDLECREVIVILDIFVVRARFHDQRVRTLLEAVRELLKQLAVVECESLKA